MTTETVSGRTVLRYRGEPVAHDVRFYAAIQRPSSFRLGAIDAECSCGWHHTIDGGHTAADLTRLARQHAGLEDEDP